MKALDSRLRVDLISAGFAMAAGICALAAFGAAYGGSHYLVVGIEGLALGIAVAFTGTRLRQPAWLVIGEGVAVYFLLGPALVAPSAAVHGFLPGPSGLAVLGRMTIQGWSGLLSTSPVVGNFHFLLVVPYLCGLICGLATMLLAMRLPRYPLAAVPPVALLVVGILFGTDTDASRIVPGGALVVVLITWVTYTQRGRADIGGRSRAGYLLAGIMVLACGVAGVLIAPQVPGASAQPRYVLRDHISPPFNVDQYVSPLSVYRQYVDPEPSGLRKKVLFTVSGATPNTYLQLATMDAYNGIVFNVAGGSEGSSASGSFATVGQPVSGEACPIAAACRRQHITVHVRDYQNVWLPTAGIVRSITFEGKESAGLASAFRYNVSTNTAVVSDGLETGSVYSMVAEVPQLPPASKLKGAGIIQGVQPAPTDVPSVVHSVAVKVTSGAPSDFQKAENIAKFLRTKGAFSNGTGTEVASLPGHGAARIASFLESPQPIGDAEQYAAAMALMARSLGLPARVVLGVLLDKSGTVSVQGKDVIAWVDIDIQGVGWYPFDPTPPSSSKANVQTRQIPKHTNPSHYQPPANVAAPPPATPANATAKGHRGSKHPSSGVSVVEVIKVAGVSLLILLVLIGPIAGIVLLKARRRTRRRHALTASAQIEGGWAELLDRASDIGTCFPRSATRQELAMLIGGTTTTMAEVANAATFGASEPNPDLVDSFWEMVDRSVRHMRADLSSWARIRASLSLTSLRRGMARRTTTNRPSPSQ